MFRRCLLILAMVPATAAHAGDPVHGTVRISGFVPASCSVILDQTGAGRVRCTSPLDARSRVLQSSAKGQDRPADLRTITVAPLV